ncbi:MAG: NAD-dependent DNA ligase LigA [Lachnospiraceae bacterium]|nr:NAD-dependent DNA ligase LigA [Lachnospiraceae bacterium]
MMNVKERLRELVDILNKASEAYYNEDREIMSNLEYDRLYDELVALEAESGIVLGDSPTVHVGYEVRDELPKVVHESPMLSLDKTKDTAALADFVGDHKALLSWKMDGLTVVLTYENGALSRAVTRGNGREGELVTANARAFKNVPLKIPFTGTLTLRGEAIIRYSDFERINAAIEDADSRYKNPRNLCSGSVRQLDAAVTAKRSVYFYAFALVSADGVDFRNSREEQFKWLTAQGFDVVEYRTITGATTAEGVKAFADKIAENDFPSDGLVVLYDDIAYGESLGSTAKFPRNAMAFKWQDELKETTLRAVEWSPSRTGLINPIAVFDPVDLEGTEVKRASLHNVSIVKELQLGIGDTVTVYKANMIIPQIAENLTRSDTLEIPKICPVCGGEAAIRQEEASDVLTLHCLNERCRAKLIRALDLFVSRNALNIEGLSEATLEKFIEAGFINDPADLFSLDRYREAIEGMEGFGEKSYANLMDSIKKASVTTLSRLVYGIGIPNVGEANARLICRAFHDDPEALKAADEETLSAIPSVGPVIARSVTAWMRDEECRHLFDRLLSCVTLEKEEEAAASPISGKTFVITGSVVYYKNRNELKAVIEKMGGKVTGSVTSKTDYLINNDVTSSSSKNKNAIKLGVPIISEDDFRELIQYAD